MEDRREGKLVGRRGEQPLELRAIGDVARHHAHPRAQPLKLLHELCRTRRVGPATAGQQEVLGATVGQPPRDVAPQRTRAAGDEHGPHGPPLPRGPAPSQRGAHETPGEQPHATHRHLVLAV